MNDGKEVKRYPFESFAWDDDPSNNNRWCDAAEVEAAFDKTIAELRAEVERITSQYQASSIEWGQTIARQAREAEVSKAVIEKLKDKLEEIRWSWANDAGRQCDNLAFEALAAIERAEGEKEHE